MGVISDALEGLMKKGFSEGMENKAAKAAWDFGGTKADFANYSPHAAEAMRMSEDVTATRQKIHAKLTEPALKLWDGIKEDPNLYNKMDFHKTTLRDIHAQLMSQGNTRLSGYAKEILDQNVDKKTGVSRNSDYTLETLGSEHHLRANRMAADQVLGPHMEHVLPIVQELYEKHTDAAKMEADTIMNILSNDTRDTIKVGGAPRSRVKNEIYRRFSKENKLRAKYGGVDRPLDLPDTEATYSEQNKFEKGYQSFIVNRLASLSAIPHIPMLFNLTSSPMMDIAKGLGSMGDQHIKDMTLAAGILSKTQHAIFSDDFAARTGRLSKIIGKGPSKVFHSIFHMPGFNTLRKHQLSLSAAVGYHSATDWAAQALKGNKRAIAELEEMHIPVEDVIKQGGKLTDEQMKTAMYHYVNNRMFIDRPMDRSLMANANPWIRSASMFHATIMSQFSFMQRELYKMAKAGDIKGLAQMGGAMGILFPAVAPWLDMMETTGRTGSLQRGMEQKDKDYEGLEQITKSGGDMGEFTKTYIDMISYIAGLGVYHSMLKSAWGDRLSTAVLGPEIGSLVTSAQDVIRGATQPTHRPHSFAGIDTGDYNWAPVGRDLSEYAVPVVGKWATHRLFPTLAEQRAGKVSRGGRRSRRRR